MKRTVVNLLQAMIVCLGLCTLHSTALAQSMSFTLLTTFTNPTPATGDYFGHSVAPVGTNLVLIGAWQDDAGATDAGAVHLFASDGTLLTTFTNPTPQAGDYFGLSVAALGNNRVLIGASGDNTGASHAGAAYIFNTTGALLVTLTNPAPANGDQFGRSVAVVGDRVLIGTPYDRIGAANSGTAYLFDTNGALLITFTNPTPASGDNFSRYVAPMGGDRVLIGSPNDGAGAVNAGAAYMFDINGALVTSFTNPAPISYDRCGWCAVALGNDRVVIGTPENDTGATDAGVAYLFDTNGTLLTTFTNPAPHADAYFGHSIAVLGNSYVLVGAIGAGSNSTGAAYLFNANGELLSTITKSIPAEFDNFGYPLAAIGSDRVLIGAYGDDTSGLNTGAAYLFSIAVEAPDAPDLAIRLATTNTVVVSWPSPSAGWALQENTNGVSSANWSNAPGPIQDDGTNKTLIVNPPTGNRFYRLFKP